MLQYTLRYILYYINNIRIVNYVIYNMYLYSVIIEYYLIFDKYKATERMAERAVVMC